MRTFFPLWLFGGLALYLLILMGIDKRAAVKGRWRIPEKRLLFIGLIGGGAGGLLGQLLFRHKIRKSYFWLIYLLGLLFSLVIGYLWQRL